MGHAAILSILQRLVSGLEENIVIFDQTGTLLHASEPLKQLVGKVDLNGATIFDFLDGKSDNVKFWLSDLSNSHFKDIRIRMIGKQGIFPARLRMAAWSVDDGFIILASIVDGTFIERRKRDLLRKTITIEQLSKSRKIREGKLHDAIYEILEMSSRAVQVERVNAWLFSKDGASIDCIGNYDASVPGLVDQESLPRIKMPNYFRLFETEKIILSSQSQQSEVTRELLNEYLLPNGIQAMMDVPIRIEGSIIGVICFEQVSETRNWSLQDQKFGLIAAQMVSLAVETHKRKMVQHELVAALHQQQRLMTETNHRIKNNLTITSSLLRMQMDKCRDDYHRSLIQDSVNRINSIASLHQLLSESEGKYRVRFEPYVRQLMEGLHESFALPGKNIQLLHTVEDCEISSSLAITLGLIINESVTNAYKHAFRDQEVGMIRVDMELNGPNAQLTILDTGAGFASGAHGQGLEIIEGLTSYIDGILTSSTDGGTRIQVDFRLR